MGKGKELQARIFGCQESLLLGAECVRAYGNNCKSPLRPGSGLRSRLPRNAKNCQKIVSRKAAKLAKVALQGAETTTSAIIFHLSRNTLRAFPSGRRNLPEPAAGIEVFLCRAVPGKQKNCFSLRLFAILNEVGGKNVVCFKAVSSPLRAPSSRYHRYFFLQSSNIISPQSGVALSCRPDWCFCQSRSM